MDSVLSSNSGRDVASNAEVTSSSDSLKKLKAGLTQTLDQASQLSARFQEKLQKAEKAFKCNGCGKVLKNEAGVKRHWSAKGNSCSEEDGFTQEAINVEITPEDRTFAGQLEIAKKVEDARRAARKVAYQLNSRKSNEGLFDAEHLMRFPIGNFARALKEAENEELERFVEMKFDRSTAPKKVMALNEIKRRKNKAS